MVFPTPSGLFSTDKSPNIAIQPFKRYLINNSYDNDLNNAYEKGCINVRINKSLTNSLTCLKALNSDHFQRVSCIYTDIRKKSKKKFSISWIFFF